MQVAKQLYESESHWNWKSHRFFAKKPSKWIIVRGSTKSFFWVQILLGILKLVYLYFTCYKKLFKDTHTKAIGIVLLLVNRKMKPNCHRNGYSEREEDQEVKKSSHCDPFRQIMTHDKGIADQNHCQWKVLIVNISTDS